MLASLALAFVATVVSLNLGITVSPMARLVLDGLHSKVPVKS